MRDSGPVVLVMRAMRESRTTVPTKETVVAARRSGQARFASIDVLRGLIMALTALDHTGDFILGFLLDPTDLTTTTPPLLRDAVIHAFLRAGIPSAGRRSVDNEVTARL